jgi:hypothetical protein
MLQVRNLLFETNSSSTHAIVVTKEMQNNTEYKELHSYEGYCFGRCESKLVDSLCNKLAYTYIVVEDLIGWKDNEVMERHPDYTKEDFINTVIEISKEYFENPKEEWMKRNAFNEDNLKSFFNELNALIKNYDAYVDHVEDFIDNGFFERVITDKEFLKRLLFDEDSYITVGGDEYRGYNLKKVGFEDDYEYNYNKEFERKYDDNKWPRWADPTEMYIGEFWDKVKELRKDYDIYFKGN